MSCWCTLKWGVYYKRFVDSVRWGGRRRMFGKGACYFMCTPDRNYPHKKSSNLLSVGRDGWYRMIKRG